ncbi:LacI family transcriptional regulator [Puteibacter caeruleilacunae]|nr:LacI family transcriptional regulator [Puteibacter caeruleilacunae]
MNKKKSTIRIKDIAQKAGVSIGTVDRVLHNRGEVSEATKEKVLKIIKELNYQPNILASSLASKKNYNFAIFIPKPLTSESYWNKPMTGIEKARGEIQQYGVNISYHFFDLFDKNSFVESSKKLIEDDPQGVILAPYFLKESIEVIRQLEQQEIPYVFIDSNIKEQAQLSYIGQNSLQSGALAARLLDLCVSKQESLLIVNFANDQDNLNHLNQRKDGFTAYFDKQEEPKRKVVSLKSNDQEDHVLHKELDDILDKNKDIKGIYVTNSKAHRVAKYIEKRNLKDIFLIGYDLIPENAKHLRSGIIEFLICQRPEEQGYNATYTLFNHIIARKETIKENYTSIDIVTKENVDYYKEL